MGIGYGGSIAGWFTYDPTVQKVSDWYIQVTPSTDWLSYPATFGPSCNPGALGAGETAVFEMADFPLIHFWDDSYPYRSRELQLQMPVPGALDLFPPGPWPVGGYYNAYSETVCVVGESTWAGSQLTTEPVEMDFFVTEGSDVKVYPGPQIALAFKEVSLGGGVTATAVPPESVPPSTNFSIVSGTSYNITTDAVFDGNVQVRIGYDPNQITVPEQNLRLYHYSDDVWTDITVEPVDTVNKMVYGQTSSFSIFTVGAPAGAVPVSIDIKSSINPKSNGKIPVAILSTPKFYAPDRVDSSSLTFGRTGNEPSLAFCTVENGKLLGHFYTQATGFQKGDTKGILKGKTVDGTPIMGSASVRIVPNK
jgi:hypothetical protein